MSTSSSVDSLYQSDKNKLKLEYEKRKGAKANDAESSVFNEIFKQLRKLSEELTTLSSQQRDKSQSNSIESFAPLADSNSEILVLGTMPARSSLVRKEYYANSRNCLWTIISRIYNNSKPFGSYEDKVACLKGNNIVLWDTLAVCDREGSVDSGITNEGLNDIRGFLEKHPNIRRIVFNGKKPSKYYIPTIEYEIAPSTSPSNTHYTIEEKIELWKKALSGK